MVSRNHTYHWSSIMDRIRQVSLALMVDGLITQLPEEVRRREYMRKIYFKIKTKISYEARTYKYFHRAFAMAEDTGKAVEKTGNDYASLSAAIKQILEKEPWLIQYFKLNQRHLDKMYKVFNTKDIEFRSKRFANTILKCLDIEVAHYNYIKEKSDEKEN